MDKEIETLRAKIELLKAETTELRRELQDLKHQDDDDANQKRMFDYKFGRE